MREGKIWGDGFADDGWRELVAVREWSDVASDEFARLFPGLIPTNGTVPERIRTFVLATASEIDASRGAIPDHRGPAHAVHGSTGERETSASHARAADAAFLRGVVTAPARAAGEGVREHDMARFAYLTGVHPAYVWPGAANLAYWGAAAAWLGALARDGRALIPEEVAEYFLDVLTPASGGRATVRDAVMGEFVRGTVDPGELLRAARKRRGAASVTVHRSAGAVEEPGLARRAARSLARLWLAFRPGAAVRTQAP